MKSTVTYFTALLGAASVLAHAGHDNVKNPHKKSEGNVVSTQSLPDASIADLPALISSGDMGEEELFKFLMSQYEDSMKADSKEYPGHQYPGHQNPGQNPSPYILPEDSKVVPPPLPEDSKESIQNPYPEVVPPVEEDNSKYESPVQNDTPYLPDTSSNYTDDTSKDNSKYGDSKYDKAITSTPATGNDTAMGVPDASLDTPAAPETDLPVDSAPAPAQQAPDTGKSSQLGGGSAASSLSVSMAVMLGSILIAGVFAIQI